jgi:hypothetical protein
VNIEDLSLMIMGAANEASEELVGSAKIGRSPTVAAAELAAARALILFVGHLSDKLLRASTPAP